MIEAVLGGLGAFVLIVAILDILVLGSRIARRIDAKLRPGLSRFGFGLRRLTGWEYEVASLICVACGVSIWFVDALHRRLYVGIFITALILILIARFPSYIGIAASSAAGFWTMNLFADALYMNWLETLGSALVVIGAFMPEGTVERLSLKVPKLATVRH